MGEVGGRGLIEFGIDASDIQHARCYYHSGRRYRYWCAQQFWGSQQFTGAGRFALTDNLTGIPVADHHTSIQANYNHGPPAAAHKPSSPADDYDHGPQLRRPGLLSAPDWDLDYVYRFLTVTELWTARSPWLS